jgi:RecA-family ATPase
VLIWDVTGSVCRLTELDARGNVVLTGLADAIVERFGEASPVVVGLDPVISFGAGERIVNDNEHSLILAARRIVRGLGCCVRLICHVSKEVARSGSLDQYASRGGSALSDGARMVAVLRSWNPEADDDKLIPPPGLSFGTGEQVIVLARPKLSYAPPQPLIWITRRGGYCFKHFIATRTDPEAEASARADQLERYLISQLKDGRRYTQNLLQDMELMKRKELRVALATLRAAGRAIDAPNPAAAHARGGAHTYLHPVAFGAPKGTAKQNGNGGQP